MTHSGGGGVLVGGGDETTGEREVGPREAAQEEVARHRCGRTEQVAREHAWHESACDAPSKSLVADDVPVGLSRTEDSGGRTRTVRGVDVAHDGASWNGLDCSDTLHPATHLVCVWRDHTVLHRIDEAHLSDRVSDLPSHRCAIFTRSDRTFMLVIQTGSRWHLCLLSEIYPMVPSDRADGRP